MIAKLRNSRGFTLVELMIVVAIVGVLAALAIYGVTKYVANAKTGEARQALGRLAKDASSSYARETMAGAILDDEGTVGGSRQLCGAAENTVPAAAASIKGVKYQSATSEWATGDQTNGWTCLRFSINEPQYFMYSYTAEGTGEGSTFSAIANGDFDADDDLSIFQIDGLVRNGEVVVSPSIQETNPEE